MLGLNEKILFDPIEVKFFDSDKKKIVETKGKIVIDFIPDFRAFITGEYPNPDLKSIFDFPDIKFIEINGSPNLIEVIPLQITPSDSVTFTLLPTESSFFVGENLEITEIKFYLTNINPLLDNEIFELDNWTVKLSAISSTSNYKRLRNSSGFLITHEGIITEENGILFKKADVQELIHFLFLLFTFANGFDTSPFYLRGFSKSGDCIWYEVGNMRVDPHQKVDNWFEYPPVKLSEFSKGFYGFYKDKIYKNHINEIIYWYVHINKKGIDKSVILSLTCLELITWLFLTIDQKSLSKDGFSKLNASDCLSLTLSSCDIPIEIPDKLKALRNLAKGDQNIENACQVLSLVRNKIVHPANKGRKRITKTNTIFEAKLLACSFIELFILFKSHYYGVYSNRVDYDSHKGKVEKVPWVK